MRIWILNLDYNLDSALVVNAKCQAVAASMWLMFGKAGDLKLGSFEPRSWGQIEALHYLTKSALRMNRIAGKGGDGLKEKIHGVTRRCRGSSSSPFSLNRSMGQSLMVCRLKKASNCGGGWSGVVVRDKREETEPVIEEGLGSTIWAKCWEKLMMLDTSKIIHFVTP